jgi:ABC-type molybdate transport system substrate-binding protein
MMLIEEYFVYLHNRIVLMVPEGNPADIKSVLDLGRNDVRISQPNPENEDIAKYIIEMYREAGGEKLVRRIMEEKKAEGTTILTLVHHRETPLRIRERDVDVGPVWATEAVYAKMQGFKIDVVELGELDQRDKVNYYIAKLRNAPNPLNAKKFLNFIKSRRAQEIYKKYDFVPHFSPED